MAVLLLRCLDCGHEYRSLVLAGTRPPMVWNCSQCGGDAAVPQADAPELRHPWETGSESEPESGQSHRYGCMCCF